MNILIIIVFNLAVIKNANILTKNFIRDRLLYIVNRFIFDDPFNKPSVLPKYILRKLLKKCYN